MKSLSNLERLAGFNSPFLEIQRKLDSAFPAPLKLQQQMEAAFSPFRNVLNNGLLEAQKEFVEANETFRRNFTNEIAALNKLHLDNMQMFKSLNTLNKFQVSQFQDNNFLKIAETFQSQLKNISAFQSSWQETLALKTEYFDRLSEFQNFNSSEDLNLELVDELVSEIDNSIQYHLNPSSGITPPKISLQDLQFYFSILLTLLVFIYQQATDKSQDIVDGVNRVEQKIEQHLQLMDQKIDSLVTLQSNLKLRVCERNTKIRKAPKPKSLVLGIVKKNQVVNIVAIRPNYKSKKWIYVSYVDYEFGTPQSGWVLKKYFHIYEE